MRLMGIFTAIDFQIAWEERQEIVAWMGHESLEGPGSPNLEV